MIRDSSKDLVSTEGMMLRIDSADGCYGWDMVDRSQCLIIFHRLTFWALLFDLVSTDESV